MRDRVVSRLVVVVVFVISAALAAACGPASAGGQASGAPTEADATITANALEFDTAKLTLPAGEGRTIRLVNRESVPHNVAIYIDDSAAQSLFVGELISRGETVYTLPRLDPGTYFFRCDLHPEMKGSLVVEG
jgi:plastocyanin